MSMTEVVHIPHVVGGTPIESPPRDYLEDHTDDECDARSTAGWFCTRRNGHEGPHMAGFSGLGNKVLEAWTVKS